MLSLIVLLSKKQIKTVRYGNVFIFCSHYYRIKAIGSGSQGGGSSSQIIWQLARVAPPLQDACTFQFVWKHTELKHATFPML